MSILCTVFPFTVVSGIYYVGVCCHKRYMAYYEQHRIDKAAAKLEMREWALAKKAALQEADAGGNGDPEAGRRPGKKTQAEWTNEWTPAQDSLLKQKCLCFRNIYVKVMW